VVKVEVYRTTAGVVKEYDHSLLTTAELEAVLSDDVEAYSLILDGVCLACGGIRRILPTTGEGFFFTTEEAFNIPYLFVQARHVWRIMTDELTRVQAMINILVPEHITFAYALGMVPEGVLRRAGPTGEDYVLFVRLR